MMKNKCGWSAAVIMSLLLIGSPAHAGSVQLPQTGQTKCYDTAGTGISYSTYLGQSGGDGGQGVARLPEQLLEN